MQASSSERSSHCKFPSHLQWLGMQLPILRHWNSSAPQVCGPPETNEFLTVSLYLSFPLPICPSPLSLSLSLINSFNWIIGISTVRLSSLMALKFQPEMSNISRVKHKIIDIFFSWISKISNFYPTQDIVLSKITFKWRSLGAVNLLRKVQTTRIFLQNIASAFEYCVYNLINHDQLIITITWLPTVWMLNLKDKFRNIVIKKMKDLENFERNLNIPYTHKPQNNKEQKWKSIAERQNFRCKQAHAQMTRCWLSFCILQFTNNKTSIWTESNTIWIFIRTLCNATNEETF